jgi:hypothetical protein
VLAVCQLLCDLAGWIVEAKAFFLSPDYTGTLARVVEGVVEGESPACCRVRDGKTMALKLGTRSESAGRVTQEQKYFPSRICTMRLVCGQVCGADVLAGVGSCGADG